MSSYWSSKPSLEFDHWAQKRIESLQALKPGARIHIIGICGTGTGALVQLLSAKGYVVTGSDKAFYPPMGDIVRKYAQEVFEGYSESSFATRPDCVVIGNSSSEQNPEVQYVLRENIPFCSMDEALRVFLIGSHEHCPTSIVVAGTHGKTTTSALCTWLFESAGRKPAYFVGGVTGNFEQTIRAQQADTPTSLRVAVLEGDEYNSAFFSRYSKFHAYRADVLIITSLEFDHGDIFPSVEAIEAQFDALVKAMPATASVYVSDSYPRLVALATKWKNDQACPNNILTYGSLLESDIRLLERRQDSNSLQTLTVEIQEDKFQLQMPLSGQHNAENALVASAVALSCGVDLKSIQAGLPEFAGVKRRQQVIFNADDILVIEDFAHHPTAVQKTLSGLVEAYQPQRTIVAFDPRSNTSRRHHFQQRYAEVFDSADLLFMKRSDPPGTFSLTGEVVALDCEKLVKDISSRGTQARVCQDSQEILKLLLENICPGDLVVLMSNGSFEGLPQELPQALSSR